MQLRNRKSVKKSTKTSKWVEKKKEKKHANLACE